MAHGDNLVNIRALHNDILCTFVSWRTRAPIVMAASCGGHRTAVLRSLQNHAMPSFLTSRRGLRAAGLVLMLLPFAGLATAEDRKSVV